MYTFTPRRPVKSFQDLEVYQKLLAVSVAVAKRLSLQRPGLLASRGLASDEITNKLCCVALDLPLKIATAHSLRFSDQLKAINTLEDVMLGCNLLIVYLEQYRDIYNHPSPVPLPNVPVPKLSEVENESQRDSSQKGDSNLGGGTIESEFFEEQIRILLTTRFKVMHLQMSWKKFMKETP